MKITKSTLMRIIKEEKRKIVEEGCGCGNIAIPEEEYYDDMESMYDTESLDDNRSEPLDNMIEPAMTTSDREFLEKGEALKAVVAIAMSTTCPITKDALLDVVGELS